jgi:hypothetical protein
MTDDGGWMRILHAPAMYLPTTAAVNPAEIATPTISTFSKLSDSVINFVCSPWKR